MYMENRTAYLSACVYVGVSFIYDKYFNRSRKNRIPITLRVSNSKWSRMKMRRCLSL